MSNFKVLWSDPGSEKRNSRKFETAVEARGFIKGLRAARTPENIALRYLDEAGEFQRVRIAEFFEAVDGAGAQASAEA